MKIQCEVARLVVREVRVVVGPPMEAGGMIEAMLVVKAHCIFIRALKLC